MPSGLHHATGHVAARAGDDELGVEADPAQGRRGEGGLEGQPDEVEPGDRAAHPPTLVRTAVGLQGAQGPQVAQVRAVAGGEDAGVDRLLLAIVPYPARFRAAGEHEPAVGSSGTHCGGVGPIVHDAPGLGDVEEAPEREAVEAGDREPKVEIPP